MACQPNAAEPIPAIDMTPMTTHVEARPDGTSFEDVLAEYQALNARLERIAAPLRLKNVGLCAQTERDPGFITHHITDYPAELQPIAETYLGLKDRGIYIRSVRRDSPADKADIQPGDKLTQLNDFPIPNDGVAQDRFYTAIARQAFGGVQTRLELQTPDGKLYKTKLRSDTACAAPVTVYFSDEINGHTDGQEILMTSALMRSVQDDVNLALIVAHEMAHILAGHQGQVPSQALELSADRMALVMMENAGYDIDAAINYWRRGIHPHRQRQDNSNTHPSIEARYQNFQTERGRIRALQKTGQAVEFN